MGQSSQSNRCNYCIMEGFKALAKQHNAALIIVNGSNDCIPNSNEAKEVYIHYKGDKQATWCAWLMSVPDHCVC